VPGRLRRQRGQEEPDPATPAPPRRIRRASSPGALRRERRAILKAREELLRDLGGLAMEMYRREQFREDLLTEHAHDIANLEARLHELDSMLAAAAAGRRTTASRCECGAPIIWGSHFCANCGRPVGAQAVVACTNCGHPLPADAGFCPSCGNATEAAKNGGEPRADAEPAADADEQSAKPDRWEE
jgi:Double zinc ribbon